MSRSVLLIEHQLMNQVMVLFLVRALAWVACSISRGGGRVFKRQL